MPNPEEAPADFAWPLVSVLFITYKRVDLLESAIRTFVAQTDYPQYEIVVSDDGSAPEIQQQIRNLPFQKTALLPASNSGLGANINKGMAACRGQYILMIQDDWDCQGPSDYLKKTIGLMEKYPDIGMVGYTMGLEYKPASAARTIFGETAYLFPRDASKRVYPYVYSDQPHVRRREVNDLMGPYLEVRGNVLKAEQDYERRWDAQTTYESAMFPAYWLKLFTTAPIERSFRETDVKNRTDRMLSGIADRLRGNKVLFSLGKRCVRSVQRLFSKYD